jgi:hypothetical protein
MAGLSTPTDDHDESEAADVLIPRCRHGAPEALCGQCAEEDFAVMAEVDDEAERIVCLCGWEL